MSRKRASIKGKGMDILFGEGLPFVEGPIPRRRAEQKELESALAAEAAAAVPPEPKSPPRPAPSAKAPTPTPQEKPLPHEVLFRPPPPAAEVRPTPPPTAEARPTPPPTAEARPTPPPTAEARPTPPPTAEAKPATAPAPTPTARAGPEPTAPPRVITPFTEAGVHRGPPGPGAEEVAEEEIPSPPPEEPSEEEEVLERVGKGRSASLAREIDELYQQVGAELSSVALQRKAERALQRLRLARDILIEDPRQFDEAEYQVNQVRLLLRRTAQSREGARRYSLCIFGYEVGWFILFVAGIILRTPLANALTYITGQSVAELQANIVPLLVTMMWGGVGGVIGALYSLHWHVSEQQDYDPQFNLSYLVKPFMGLVLGGIIYLVVRTGFLALQATGSTTARAAEWFPFLVACLAGFRQTFAYEILDQLIQVITPTPRREEEEEEEIAAQAPASSQGR